MYARRYRKRLFKRRPKKSRYARKRQYKRVLKKTATHTYRRMFEWGNIAVNNDIHTSLSFRLNLLPNYTEFTSLYDQYKIKKIIWRIERAFTGNDASQGSVGTTVTTNKFIRAVHDYDGGSSLSTEYQYLEYQNCKSYSAMGQRPLRLTLYPKVQDAIFKTDAKTSYASSMIKPPWIDVANHDVEHYGIKLFTPMITPSGNTQVHRVFATVIFQCKNTR